MSEATQAHAGAPPVSELVIDAQTPPHSPYYRVENRLQHWIHRAGRRLDRNADVYIIVTGETGIGKSTCALQLAKKLDPRFNGGRVAWSAPDALRIGLDTPRRGAVLFDEGVEGAYNRDSMSHANREYAKWLYICRQRNLVQLTCFPNLSSVDLSIREQRAWTWIWVWQPGRATIHEFDTDEYRGNRQPIPVANFTFDKFADDDLYWIDYEQRKHAFVQKSTEKGIDKLRTKR